jgi:hypothetical protein
VFFRRGNHSPPQIFSFFFKKKTGAFASPILGKRPRRTFSDNPTALKTSPSQKKIAIFEKMYTLGRCYECQKNRNVHGGRVFYRQSRQPFDAYL